MIDRTLKKDEFLRNKIYLYRSSGSSKSSWRNRDERRRDSRLSGRRTNMITARMLPRKSKNVFM